MVSDLLLSVKTISTVQTLKRLSFVSFLYHGFSDVKVKEPSPF